MPGLCPRRHRRHRHQLQQDLFVILSQLATGLDGSVALRVHVNYRLPMTLPK
jgi:hypothetical protein